MAAKTLQCTVVTPEKAIFDDACDQVVVPAHDGEVGILPGHARFLARLGSGELRLISGGKTQGLYVEGGFVQVADDRVTILTDNACEFADIDVTEAEMDADRLRGKMRGEELADATHRLLVKKRVKSKFNRS
jgi:F-type H+-transporting ATPase subunit epsilon